MQADSSTIETIAATGTLAERIKRVAHDIVLERGDQLHAAYVPTGETNLSSWESVAHEAHLTRASRSKGGLVLQSDPKHEDRPLTLAVFREDRTPLTGILGIGRRGDFRNAHNRLTRHVYPRVMRPYFSQLDFATFFRELQRQFGRGAQLYLTRVGARRWLTREKTKTETSLTWTERPYSQVFEEAREQGYFFHNVVFDVRINGRATNVSGALGRPNLISLSPMAAVRLGEFATDRLRRHAVSRLDLVTDRSRGRTFRLPRPILAKFADPVFADKGAARQVADRFHKYPRASIAIIHGNPYVHARIVDLDDSSSYAVFVTSSDRMMLIPQIRSSEPSFSRLLEFVHDSFGDAEFADAPKAYA